MVKSIESIVRWRGVDKWFYAKNATCEVAIAPYIFACSGDLSSLQEEDVREGSEWCLEKVKEVLERRLEEPKRVVDATILRTLVKGVKASRRKMAFCGLCDDLFFVLEDEGRPEEVFGTGREEVVGGLPFIVDAYFIKKIPPNCINVGETGVQYQVKIGKAPVTVYIMQYEDEFIFKSVRARRDIK